MARLSKAKTKKPRTGRRAIDVERLVTLAFIRCICRDAELTADTVFNECLRVQKLKKNPDKIASMLPGLFRHFASKPVGAIKRTGTFILSTRSSSPLPVYRTCPKEK